MIGSGVFLLPAGLAPFGWNGVFGWIVTIAGGLCLAATFAVLAHALPRAGGPYAYTQAAFGPFPAFLVAWSYWVSMWVGNAGIAIGAVSYLSSFAPGFAAVSGAPAAATCALIWILTAINCLGVREAGQIQFVTTILKLVPLVVVAVVAGIILGRHGSAALVPFHAADIHLPAIGAAATLTLWGLLGLESATVPADKVRDPARTIPRATIIGTAATGLIYLVVCSAVTLLAPPEATARSSAPLADFVAGAVGGQAGGWAGQAVALFAAISALGALNGWIMLQGELPCAMARGGVFPAWLGKLSRRDTPVNAHVASSLLLTIVLLLNYTRSMAQLFTFIVLLATTASLFAYLACAAAALRLAKTKAIALAPAMHGVVALAGAYALWTIWGAGFEAVGWGLVLVALGIPIHLLMRRTAAMEATA